MVVVRAEPFGRELPDRGAFGDDELRQPFGSHRPLLGLDVCVLLQPSGLDVLDPDAVLVWPVRKGLADGLGAVIEAGGVRCAAPLDDPIQSVDHPRRRQLEIHFGAGTFAVRVIDHVRQPEAALVAEPIVHEVHRPALVGTLGHRQRLRFLPYDAFFGSIGRFSSSSR